MALPRNIIMYAVDHRRPTKDVLLYVVPMSNSSVYEKIQIGRAHV